MSPWVRSPPRRSKELAPGYFSGPGWRLGFGLMLALGAVCAWLLSTDTGLDELDGLTEPPPPGPAPLEALAPAAPPEPPVEAGLEAPRVRVVQVVGEAQRAHGEAWELLRPGDALAQDDSVRTGVGARVDVWMGDDSARLSIPERSEVRMGEVTRALHTLRLERGRLEVDYRGGGPRVLRVQSPGGAVAETREARFTLLRHGALVAVVTRAGEVGLTSADATIQVGTGQQGLAFDGARPIGPEPIPLDVLLKVARASSAPCLSLAGRVRVGTQVWVEDEEVEVSPEGAFQSEVPRAPGRSRVKVVAREPGGATREVFLECRAGARDERPRPESVKFRWNEAP